MDRKGNRMTDADVLTSLVTGDSGQAVQWLRRFQAVCIPYCPAAMMTDAHCPCGGIWQGSGKENYNNSRQQQGNDLLQYRYNHMSRFLNKSAPVYVLNSSILKDGKLE